MAGARDDGVVPYARRADVIYGRKDGLALTMEVLTPGAPNGLGAVWVVSRSGRSSRAQTVHPSFERRVSPLLAHGYTVFAVIHGSAPRFPLPDQVRDVRRAVRYVRHHAREHGIDGQRLAIAGASAGGLLALVTAMQGRDGEACSDDAVERTSSRVQAAGCFFPPTDLVNFGRRARTIVDFLRQTYGEVDPTFQFSAVEDQPEPRPSLEGRGGVRRLLRELSPVTHVTAEAPPTLLIHGAEDAAVPLQQSRRLVERLQAAQVAARLVVREGRGHAWPGWEADTALLAAWFDRHLRLLPLPPEPPWTPAAGVGRM